MAFQHSAVMAAQRVPAFTGAGRPQLPAQQCRPASATSPLARLPARAARLVVRAEGEDAAPPAPSVSKGAIVRVNKEKYLSSVEFKAVDHPPYFKGLDYIYEARGEVLDVRSFSSGQYALIAWAGIPTAPAWLPVYMLDKAAKLEYKRV